MMKNLISSTAKNDSSHLARGAPTKYIKPLISDLLLLNSSQLPRIYFKISTISINSKEKKRCHPIQYEKTPLMCGSDPI